MLIKVILIFWPVLVTVMALLYNRKQNSERALPGGPISMQKSFWLSYTVTSWFFLPIVFLFFPECEAGLKATVIFHLCSWWIRGILELFMIYKFFNWSPHYGISHDFFHITGLVYFLSRAYPDFQSLVFYNTIVAVYLLISVVATSAEITFAFLFLNTRTKDEADSYIYFASDDPKWKFINRITAFFVSIMMGHLLWQSGYTIKKLLLD